MQKIKCFEINMYLLLTNIKLNFNTIKISNFTKFSIQGAFYSIQLSYCTK